MKCYDYIVIGGGVAGMASLHRLRTKLDKSNVLLLEKDNKCGGLVKSSFKEDFLVETGPNAYLKGYKHTKAFVEELGLQDQVIYNTPGADNRFVFRNNSIHKIPEGPFAFFSSKLFTLRAKLRLLIEPFKSSCKSDEESVYEFGRRRFGKEISETVMDAMVSGICAGDFRKLDVFSLFPKIGLIEKKFKSFLLFLVLFKFKSTEKNTDNKSVTFRSLKNGMGTISDAAHKKYSDYVKTDTEVESITKYDDNYLIKTNQGMFLTKKIVFACPANIASILLKTAHSKLADDLASIPYSSIVTCLLAYNSKSVAHPLNGFGFLVPRNQNRRILGGLFSSGLFENRAPSGYKSIKVYIGGAHDIEILEKNDSEIKAIISDELSPMLGISSEPEFCKISKIKNAIPQFNIGHREIKKSIYNELKQHPNIFLTGNYLEGISVNEAIKSSESIK